MKTFPWLTSMAVHGLVLLLGGLSMQQAVVGISPGRNSVEVNLVASPSEPAATVSPQPTPEPPVLPVPQPPLPQVDVPRPTFPTDPIPAPQMTLPSAWSATKPVPHTTRSHAAREVSMRRSRQNGRDAVTEQAVGGAIVDEQPDYLSNPPPIYPEEAREQEQQGVVVLDVIVSTEGQSETIRIASSSGYYLLDDAARDAVRHYRFRPATLEGLKVRSHVRVPIRFQLDGN